MLKIQNVMDIKEFLLLWFINVLIKKLSGSGVNEKVDWNE